MNVSPAAEAIVVVAIAVVAVIIHLRFSTGKNASTITGFILLPMTAGKPGSMPTMRPTRAAITWIELPLDPKKTD